MRLERHSTLCICKGKPVGVSRSSAYNLRQTIEEDVTAAERPCPAWLRQGPRLPCASTGTIVADVSHKSSALRERFVERTFFRLQPLPQDLCFQECYLSTEDDFLRAAASRRPLRGDALGLLCPSGAQPYGPPNPVFREPKPTLPGPP